MRVSLKHSHPYLAEYKRRLETEHRGKFEKRDIFPDTGGYAWVKLTNRNGTLEISDIGGTQSATRLDKLPKRVEYLGRFDFDSRRVFRFIPASEDRRQPEVPK